MNMQTVERERVPASHIIHLALQILTPLQRAVIIRRYGLDGAPVRSHDRIAKTLRLSATEVRFLEEIAMERLREQLGVGQDDQRSF